MNDTSMGNTNPGVVPENNIPNNTNINNAAATTVVTPVVEVAPAPVVEVAPTPVVEVAPASVTPVVEVASAPVPVPPAPVAPAAPATPVVESSVTPVAQAPVTPVAPAAPSVEVTPSVEVVQQNTENETEEKSEEKADSDTEPVVEEKKNIPYVLILIVIVLVVAALLYYYVYLTPKAVYSSAFNSAFDKFNSFVDSINNAESKDLNVDIGIVLHSDVKKGDVSIEGHRYHANIDVDLNKQMFATEVSFFDNKNQEDNNTPRLSGKLFSNQGDIFVTKADSPALLQFNTNDDMTRMLNVSVDRMAALVKSFEDIKDGIVENVDENNLTKSLAFKQVGGQTTLAIKIYTKLDTEGINSLFKPIAKNFLEDDEMVKKFALAIGATEEETNLILEDWSANGVSIKNLEIDLYMNLANTSLVGIDFKLDNWFFELDYLNGLYDINVIRYDEGSNHKNLVVDFEYDVFHDTLYGNVVVDNENNYVKIVIDYKRKNESDVEGNTLDLTFYDKPDAKEPVAVANCELIITDNSDHKLLNELTDDTVIVPIQILNNPIAYYASTEFAEYRESLSESKRSALDALTDTPAKMSAVLKMLNDAKNELRGFMYDGNFMIYHLFNNKLNIVDINYAEAKAEEFTQILINPDYKPSEVVIEDPVVEEPIVEEPEEPVDENIIPATSISTTPTTKTINVGSTFNIVVTLVPENTTDTVTFTSTDSKIAKVDSNGKVTGVKAGKATITVKAGEVSASIVVTVKATETTGELSDAELAKIEEEITNEVTEIILLKLDEGEMSCKDLKQFACDESYKLAIKKGLSKDLANEACTKAKNDPALLTFCTN